MVIAFGDHKLTLAYLRRTMGKLTKYHSADLPELMETILKNSFGMDNYFDQFYNTTTTNYPCLLYTSPSPRHT